MNSRCNKYRLSSSVHRRMLIEDLLRVDPRCAYCRQTLTMETATIDHVRPRCLGGTLRNGNRVIACLHCNNAKAAKLAFSGPTGKLRKPPKVRDLPCVSDYAPGNNGTPLGSVLGGSPGGTRGHSPAPSKSAAP